MKACFQILFSFENVLSKFGTKKALMVILRKSPSHADATLALSDTCRLQDDTNASKELLERLLYLLEQNLHPRCSIGSGKNRFDYNRPENRALFGALFRQAFWKSTRRIFFKIELDTANFRLGEDVGAQLLSKRSSCFPSILSRILLHQSFLSHCSLFVVDNFTS